MLSGLKANIEKTKYYNIGTTDFSATDMKGFSFEKDDVKLLGITISKNKKVSDDKNFDKKAKAAV